MRKIKTYEDFINEELSLKKAVVGAALGASLIGCGPGDKHVVDNPQKTEVVATVEKKFNELPNSFDMDEELITIGTDMDITANGDNYGKVEQRTMNWGKTFELFDTSGNKVASAQQEVFSLYTDIKIKDENGKLIGTVEEEILDSLFSLYSIYTIKDANGQVIAKSEKLDFFTTSIEIFDHSGNKVVGLEKAFLSIGDSWSVEFSGNIDKRVIVFIPAFVTSAQAERRSSQESNNK